MTAFSPMMELEPTKNQPTSASDSICCSAAATIAHARRVPRCPWATTEPAIAYHDEEWGVPVHDDRKLFEFLILEGAQAGLSWITILKKRKSYRKAFDGFRAEKIARYGTRDVKRLLGDAGIVRNRLKIAATIENAKAFLALREEMESFDAYLWSFVGGKPKQNRWRSMVEVPARTAEIAGTAGEYKYDNPMDHHWFRFTGLTAEALKAELATGKGDGEMLAWIEQNAPHKRTPWEIQQWSAYHNERGPDGDVETLEFFTKRVGDISKAREDVKTWFDYLDLDDHVTFGGKA